MSFNQTYKPDLASPVVKNLTWLCKTTYYGTNKEKLSTTAVKVESITIEL